MSHPPFWIKRFPRALRAMLRDWPILALVGASLGAAMGSPALAQLPQPGAAGGIFEIDGNAKFDDGTLDGYMDWTAGDGIGFSVFQCVDRDCRQSIPGLLGFMEDPAGMGIYSGSRSRDSDEISLWRWADGSVQDRYEMLHGMWYTFEDALADRWITIAADRQGTGTGWAVSVWILLTPLRLLPDGTFLGTHTGIDATTNRPRDVLVIAEFNASGILVDSQFYMWDPSSPTNLSPPPTGAIDPSSILMAMNPAPVCAPWRYGGAVPPTCPAECQECFPQTGFLEMAINLGAFGFGGQSGDVCGPNAIGGAIIIASRTSSAVNSQLHDFVFLDLHPEYPTAALDDGTTGEFVRLAASARASSDRLVQDGTLVCGSIPPVGVGYDLSRASLWLNESVAETALYVSVDLYGHPGDSDGDGAYGTTAQTPSDCSGFGYLCPVDEGVVTDTVFHGVEGVTVEVDRDLDGVSDLAFRVGEDELAVVRNDYEGPAAGTVIGGFGAAWSAAPLVPDGTCLADVPCLDITGRTGNILLRIPSWQAYFPPGLGYAVWDAGVISTGDGGGVAVEDVVGVPFRRRPPVLSVTPRLERVSPNLCSSADTVVIGIDVWNRGTAALDTIEVKTQVPLSFKYLDVVSDPDSLGEPRVREESGNRALTWGDPWNQARITLAPGATKTIQVAFETEKCLGSPRAWVSASALQREGVSGGKPLEIECSLAGVQVEELSSQACGSGAVQEIPFRVVNTGTHEETIGLAGFVNGIQGLAVPSRLVLGAGEEDTVLVRPAEAVVGETATAVLEATATVSQVSDTPCEAVAIAESTVDLVAPEFEIVSEAGPKFPPGGAGYALFQVTNLGSSQQEYTLSGKLDRADPDSIWPSSPVTLGPGESMEVRIWGRMPNPCAGDVDALLEITSTLLDPEGCTTTGISTALSQCSTVRLTIPTPSDKTYRGVSFPLLRGQSGSDLLSTVRAALGPQQNFERWRLFGWDGSRYLEVDAEKESQRLERIEPGRGYWLITAGRDETLDLSGEPVGLDAEFSVTLDHPDTAFFQIAVPFLHPTSVTAIQVAAPGYERQSIEDGVLVEATVREWTPGNGRDGQYIPRNVLERGHAYWIKKIVRGPVQVYFAPVSGGGPGPAMESPESMPRGAAWAIRVRARLEDREFGSLWMGAVTGNEESGRSLDLSLAPPPPGGYGLVLFIPRSESGISGGNYVREFRPLAESMVWDFQSSQRVDGQVRITVERWGVPDGVTVRWFDLDSGEEHAISESTTVILLGDRLTHRMRVQVGPDGVIPPDTPRAIPMIHPAFPNPFRGTAMVRLSVSERCDANIRVYDSLGRRIAVPLDGAVGPGEVIVPWDGRDASGRSTAAGIYFLEIRLGEQRSTQRLVKLRD